MKINERLKKLENKIKAELIRVYFKDGSTKIISGLKFLQISSWSEKSKNVDRFEVMGRDSERSCAFYKLVKSLLEI